MNLEGLVELVKVLFLGIIISILVVFLKQVKPEFSLLVLIVGSIVLLIYILNYLTNIFVFFQEIIDKTGISNSLFVSLLKIVGLGYLVEFSASVCRDSGNTSIADKVLLAGKIMIFVVSMPIIRNLFEMILELI